MIKVGIWLDDFRDPDLPQYKKIWKIYGLDDLEWALSYEQFQDKVTLLLKRKDTHALSAVFFDNDLGDRFGREGRHAFSWLEQIVHERELPSFHLHAQTDNPAAREELHRGFDALNRYWDEVENASG